MSFDSQQGDSRLFRLVLTGVLLVYGAVAVWTIVAPAPPPKREPTDQLRIAQLLIQTEEERLKAEEEAKKKAEEEARKKAEAEAKRLAEEAARKKAEAEARKKAEEEARKKAEAEAKRLAEEEARRKAEEEARKKLDAEARKKAEEEAKRLAEEEARRLAELKKLQAEQAALKEAEEARKRAEAERQRVLEEQRLAEERRQQAIAEDLRRKEAARVAAIEAERRRVEEEKLAAARAAAARQLARIKAAQLEMQRRQEIARQNQEAAMGAGLMDGLDEPDESLDEFLDDPDAPLVGGSSGTLLGGSTAVENVDQTSSGIDADELAQIDTLLEDLGDLEGMDALLADTAPGEAASLEEIQAFLEGVAAGRIVGGEMVARDITVVESPFKILSEVGGVGTRTSEAITQIIHSHTGEIKRFYDKALVKLQGLSGTVTVRMRIAADGTVQEVTVVDSTTGYPGFDRALLQRIKKWQFPPTSGRFIEGTYPFRFAEGF